MGYVKALKKHGIPANHRLITPYLPNQSVAREEIYRLLSTSPRPDAVFAFNDYLAFEAMEVAKSMKLNIPEDVALVGFGDEPVASHAEPKLTTVAQPAFQIGQTAAEELIWQLDNKEIQTVPKNKVLKTKLVVRGSSSRTMAN